MAAGVAVVVMILALVVGVTAGSSWCDRCDRPSFCTKTACCGTRLSHIEVIACRSSHGVTLRSK